MTPTPKENAIMLLGCALMLANVFHKPLGLPDLAGDLMMLAAGVCIFAFVRLRRRSRLHVGTAPPDPSDKQKGKKHVWLIIFSIGLGSLTFPFFAPSIGKR